jgi:hypothetical protein
MSTCTFHMSSYNDSSIIVIAPEYMRRCHAVICRLEESCIILEVVSSHKIFNSTPLAVFYVEESWCFFPSHKFSRTSF